MQLSKALQRFTLPQPRAVVRGIRDWLVLKGPWYACSFAGHLLLLVLLTLLGSSALPSVVGNAPSFEAEMDELIPETELTEFDVGEAPLEPTVLDTESLMMNEAPEIAQTEVYYDDNAEFIEAGGGSASEEDALALGGLGGFDVSAIGDGPAVRGPGGVGAGVGEGGFGNGGDGNGFGGRGQGSRKAMVGSGGGTRQTERAVAAALNWIARHQNRDGSWSLHNYHTACSDPTCTGHGVEVSDSAATAFALLPFLAAGQTHKTKGPYRAAIFGGLGWLMKNQKPNGDLSAGAGQVMYTHGLAAIAMCEAYGLTQDKRVGESAQAAIRFIEEGQDPQTGGWWYQWKQAGGDTSVFGWQLMALKSASMAGLEVNPSTFEGGRAWLQSVSKGEHGGLFCYTPASGPGDAMTAVGLLCSQYLGMKRDEPAMQEGVQFIMARLPNSAARNSYFWYYATQVMHNVPGAEWDTWNRSMRRTFIDTQEKAGCAAGSWDPLLPTPDPFGTNGGRLMVTSIAALSLEVYYRYLPLYKMDRPDEMEDAP